VWMHTQSNITNIFKIANFILNSLEN
jgi:hypothetical protein